MRRAWCAAAALCLILPALSPGAARAQEAPALSADLPEGEGRELVQFHCTICHDLGVVRQQHLSEALWKDVLRDMRNFGAVFTDAQRAAIIAYLVQHFGP